MSIRQFRAAVLREPNKPLAVEQVEVPQLYSDDVLVRIEATSVCHTDLETYEGDWDCPMPVVPGHEGAGVVEEVGPEVCDLAPGDRVILHWNPVCGTCFYCEQGQPILCEQYGRNYEQSFHFDGHPRLYIGNEPVHTLMYLGTFAEYCVVPEQSAIRVASEMPPSCGCMIGCGVMTGFGATVNTAPVGWGNTVTVIGMGALGLSAVQGARMSGASAVLAVDLDDDKLQLAREVGATDLCNARQDDPVAAARAISDGRGTDHVFEAAGARQALRHSLDAARPGGEVVWLGKVPVDEEVSFQWASLMPERRIVRSSYGAARPHRDFPRLARSYLDGDLKLDAMVSRRIALDEINEAFAALQRGEVIRTVIEF